MNMSCLSKRLFMMVMCISILAIMGINITGSIFASAEKHSSNAHQDIYPLKSLTFNADKSVLSFADENDVERQFQLNQIVDVFGKDAKLDILDDNIYNSNSNSKPQSIPLRSTSKSYMIQQSDGTSLEWGVFNIRIDANDPSKYIMHGVFTTDGGKTMLQLEHVNRHASDMVETRYRKLVDDASLTMHSLHQVSYEKEFRNLKEQEPQKLPGVRCANSEEGVSMQGKLNAQQQQITFGEYFPFFPNCYDGDSAPRQFNIGIAVDLGYYEAAGSDIEKVKAEIESIVSSTRIVYMKQLNVIPVVQMVVISTSKSQPYPLNQSKSAGTCVTDMSYALSQFGYWNAANNDNIAGREQGHWHLLTNCWPPPGISGYSEMNSLCDKRRNVGVTNRISSTMTWLIFAHELGHSFGATHSFGVGGLMDYSNYNWNGIPQFDSGKRVEMCTEINNVVNTCKHFSIVQGATACGNGIIEEGEMCECLTFGQKSCGACNQCQISNPKVKCSTKDFQMRITADDFKAKIIIVKRDSLSNPQCCSSDGELATPKTMCNNGNDVCMNGQCERVCSAYNLASCASLNNGCTQPCNYFGRCTSTLVTLGGKKVSWVDEGTYCGDGKVCSAGECIPVSSATSTPTTATTTASPSSKAPTTASPTRPSLPPSKPTNTPVRAPTNSPIRAPSTAPTSAPTTTVPTLSPNTFKRTKIPTTDKPTKEPTTDKPTRLPTTRRPTTVPTTRIPTTDRPTKDPTLRKGLTYSPSLAPSRSPTFSPINTPTLVPTKRKRNKNNNSTSNGR